MLSARKGRFSKPLTMPFERLWAVLGNSELLRLVASLYPRIQSLFRKKRPTRRYSAYFFLHALEKSFFLGGGSRLLSHIASFTLGSIGQIGVLYGIFSTALWFMLSYRTDFIDPILASGLAFASVPMMNVGNAFSTELGKSRLLGRFFFDFCGCPLPERVLTVRHSRWRGILIALPLALLGIWIPVWKQLAVLLSLFLVYLLFLMPELGVCALLFFLPFLNLFSAPTKILLLFVLVLTLSWFKKAICGRRPLQFTLLDCFILLLSVLYLLGGFLGVGEEAGLLEGATRAALLLVWFPVRSLLENAKWRERARVSLIAAAGGIAVLGIAEYLFGMRELLFVDAERFGNLGSRVCATYGNPNFLALYLVLTAPMLAAGIFNPARKKRYRILESICLALVLICTVLTWTRGAWLGILVACLLFLLLYSNKSFTFLLFSPFLLFFALPSLPSSVTDRFLSIVGRGDSSIHYRMYTWMGVTRMLEAYPFGIGVGEHAFCSVYPSFAVSGTERVMHAHRLDLQLFAESGWIGFLIFASFFALLFLRIVHGLYVLRDSNRCALLCCFCALVGALVMGAFDYIWYHFGNFTLFFILAAWSAAVCGEVREST